MPSHNDEFSSKHRKDIVDNIFPLASLGLKSSKHFTNGEGEKNR